MPVAVINPGRIRHYALGEGLIAKTDKVDARIIALFALKIAPSPTAIRNRAAGGTGSPGCPQDAADSARWPRRTGSSSRPMTLSSRASTGI